MSITRHIFGIVLSALVFSGCAQSNLPNENPAIFDKTNQADWMGFLPIDTILSGDLVDFEASQADIRNLQARILHLRRRARLLKGPIVTVQERLRMQQALKLHRH